jgi:hypothetical protein
MPLALVRAPIVVLNVNGIRPQQRTSGAVAVIMRRIP